MKRKQKGINAERELIHMFWAAGWAAIRAAGSGNTTHPSPDVLAGSPSRRLAIECKSIGSSTLYLPKAEVVQLDDFSHLFCAEPWVGVRFGKNMWYFVPTNGLTTTEKNAVVSKEEAQMKGLLFSELIG